MKGVWTESVVDFMHIGQPVGGYDPEAKLRCLCRHDPTLPHDEVAIMLYQHIFEALPDGNPPKYRWNFGFDSYKKNPRPQNIYYVSERGCTKGNPPEDLEDPEDLTEEILEVWDRWLFRIVRIGSHPVTRQPVGKPRNIYRLCAVSAYLTMEEAKKLLQHHYEVQGYIIYDVETREVPTNGSMTRCYISDKGVIELVK